ncbi:MAG: DUF2080 family transposase-associated protein [Archaeoglobaceae archaeon]
MEVKKSTRRLTKGEIECTLGEVVGLIGGSARADVPKRYLNEEVYVIITKDGDMGSSGFFPKADKFESVIYWLTEMA